MTSQQEGHDLHVLLGAFVLGGLSDEDHRAFTEHLRTCATCQLEAGQVSGLPRLLDLVVPDDLPEPTTTSGLTNLLGELRRRKSRQRWLRVAAASVLAALCLGVGAIVGPRLTAPAERPTVRYSAVAAPGSGVEVEVALVTRGWGTEFEIDCEQMPLDGELALWVIDRQGHATSVASWNATSSGYATVTAASAIRSPQVRALEVRTADGRVIATATT